MKDLGIYDASYDELKKLTIEEYGSDASYVDMADMFEDILYEYINKREGETKK